MDKVLLLVLACLQCARSEQGVSHFDQSPTRQINSKQQGEANSNDVRYTSTNNKYQSTGVFIGGPHNLVFGAKSSRDAVIGLATTDSDESLQWEIVIGGGNNQLSTYVRSLSGTCDDKHERRCDVKSKPLDPNVYRTFWLSWDETSIRVGTGSNVGQGEYCNHKATFKLTDLYARLRTSGSNTVNWIIYGYVRTQNGTVVPAGTKVLPGNKTVCDSHICDPNAYCRLGQDGRKNCQCHLGYISSGRSCQTDTHSGLSPDLQGQIKAGMEAGALIGDVIKDAKVFADTITQIASIASPFFSAASIVIDFAFMIFPSQDSQILVEMRQYFTEVNLKLEQIKTQIVDLSTQIEWSTYKPEFENYARKINTLCDKIEHLDDYEPGSDAFNSYKDSIIDYYGHFDGDEFVHFLTDDILGGFFESFVQTVHNDRARTQNLMRVALYYVTRASQVNMVYLSLSKVPKERIENEKKNWCKHFQDIQTKLANIDKQVKDAWDKQAKNYDIPKFLQDHSHLSHYDFANQLLNFLSKKYYWRVWFVASYDPIAGYDKHAVYGTMWFWWRTNGRNLVVVSVQKGQKLNAAQVWESLYKYEVSCCRCTNVCYSQLNYNCYSRGEDKAAARLIRDALPYIGQMKLIVESGHGLQAVSQTVDNFVRADNAMKCFRHFTIMYFG